MAADSAQPELSREESMQRKGPVALLQEFVQSSRQFAAPQNQAILQWAYDQRMTPSNALEFRASVAFLFDGVPHHVAGGWCSSKKVAQRDAAERGLVFFIGRWGEQLLAEDQGSDLAQRRQALQRRSSDVQALEDFCSSYSACGGVAPRWRSSEGPAGHVAQVELALLGVTHIFGGAQKPTAEAARGDAARRVLWYFQAPGYEHLFSPDVTAIVKGRRIPAPPANWACTQAEAEAHRNADRKTALMRVQNRLQQHLSKRLQAGQSVWEWSYELDETDTQWPPLCRATVSVPAMKESFLGPWARGQRAAQIEASYLVADFLDGDSEDTSAPTSEEAPGSAADSEEVFERITCWADAGDDE